jgi:WhiB family redox-sensing transcriptional regulator
MQLLLGAGGKVPDPGWPASASESWKARAACRDVATELFFPGAAEEDVSAAKAVCAGCPVRSPCLAFAVLTGQDDGVWGGTDAAERKRYRRRA